MIIFSKEIRLIIGKILGYSPRIWIIPMIILLSQDYLYGYWTNPMIIPIGILLSPGYAINFHGISTVFFVSSQAELAKAYRSLALKYHPVTRRQGGVLRC
jgi:hypothetical protein